MKPTITEIAQSIERQRHREEREIALAKSRKQSRSYIDDDGCEVTVTATGHVFYNAGDWY